jgi:hypothetical protein
MAGGHEEGDAPLEVAPRFSEGNELLFDFSKFEPGQYFGNGMGFIRTLFNGVQQSP